ncbi:unnamed protein product [Lupinus luteus]|uniref:Uncharacterized protein n=1 Tax=Lupinus luteus TaxID=3873 RepID=A0AAV1WNG2_LUPLU
MTISNTSVLAALTPEYSARADVFCKVPEMLAPTKTAIKMAKAFEPKEEYPSTLSFMSSLLIYIIEVRGLCERI